MILLTILAIMTIILTGIAIVALSIGGALAIMLFGDVFLCILIIVWLVRRKIKKKH